MVRSHANEPRAARPRRTPVIHRKPTLGRGLADLLGARASPQAAAPVGEQLAKLPLDLLQRGRYQPRIDMHPESLAELADSIKAQGEVPPIELRAPSHPAGTPLSLDE